MMYIIYTGSVFLKKKKRKRENTGEMTQWPRCTFPFWGLLCLISSPCLSFLCFRQSCHSNPTLPLFFKKEMGQCCRLACSNHVSTKHFSIVKFVFFPPEFKDVKLLCVFIEDSTLDCRRDCYCSFRANPPIKQILNNRWSHAYSR